MPELPEVETTRRGVTPHVVGRRVEQVNIYDRRLRWPVPDDYETTLGGRVIAAIERRAKYHSCGMTAREFRSFTSVCPAACG